MAEVDATRGPSATCQQLTGGACALPGGVCGRPHSGLASATEEKGSVGRRRDLASLGRLRRIPHARLLQPLGRLQRGR